MKTWAGEPPKRPPQAERHRWSRNTSSGVALALSAIWLFLGAAAGAFGQGTNSGPDRLPPLVPPRGEIPPGLWERYGSWIVLGSALLVLALGFAVWYFTRPRPVPEESPVARARRDLEALRHQPETGAVLSRVSQILRHYLAAVFGLPPEELTTTEFCRALAANDKITPELRARVADFLRCWDQRKFAPGSPGPRTGVAEQALQLVRDGEARLEELRRAAQPASGRQAGRSPETVPPASSPAKAMLPTSASPSDRP